MNITDNNQSTNQVVSCIVPVLNEGDAISDFISSLHQQDYRPIELIIVDGGSKDDTIDIVNSSIDKLSEESFSIRLFRECDFGEISSPANARNIGLDAAQGEFIFFIDADTCFIDVATISTAVCDMNRHDFVIIYFKPLIDTKLEYYISKTMKLDGFFLYRSKILEHVRFIPTLGFGEDREFNHSLFGCVTSSEQVSSQVFVGRHYPHTKTELRKQNEWYGRTILKYMNVIYHVDKQDFLRQFAYIIYNISLACYPVVIIVSLIVSLKLTVILLLLFFTQILTRFIKYNCNSLHEYVFLIWYSLYNGIFFTKGLVSNIYKKNSIGRT